jgi:hypothetical protein
MAERQRVVVGGSGQPARRLQHETAVVQQIRVARIGARATDRSAAVSSKRPCSQATTPRLDHACHRAGSSSIARSNARRAVSKSRSSKAGGYLGRADPRDRPGRADDEADLPWVQAPQCDGEGFEVGRVGVVGSAERQGQRAVRCAPPQEAAHPRRKSTMPWAIRLVR